MRHPRSRRRYRRNVNKWQRARRTDVILRRAYLPLIRDALYRSWL